MPPKRRSRGRGGRVGTRGRGRGRGTSIKRGSIRSRLLSSSCTATTEDTDVEGTSTDGNIPLKQSLSPSISRKKNITEYNEERELSLPRLKSTIIPENSTLLSMLCHDKKSDYVMTDDELDHVQWDLESMLTSIIIRKNTVKEELRTFAKTMQFGRSQHRTSKNSKFPTIRPRAAAEISPVNECRKLKVEFDPLSKELPPSKTESANKFWSMVEPFLARAKKDDLNWLEDLVKSYHDNKKLYEIPPLGEHYAKRWAQEELEMQKNQSSCSPRPAKRLKLSERLSPDVVELVNKLDLVAHEDTAFIPLYRKVLASISEYSHLSGDEIDEHFPDLDDFEDRPHEMSTICKEFYAEQNVKKQLHKLGLISHNAKPTNAFGELPSSLDTLNEDYDEILEEIYKCDASLTQLRALNEDHLTKLLEKCRLDYCQKTIRNQLDEINNEILQFKRQQNETLTTEKPSVQISREEGELRLLLDQRSHYILQLQSKGFEPIGYLSPSVSDDSESSEDESDSSKVLNVKLEPLDPNTSIKSNENADYESQVEINYEHVDVSIKQEVEKNIMDCEEANNDVVEMKCKENVVDEVMVSEEVDKTFTEKNDTTKKTDDDGDDDDDDDDDDNDNDDDNDDNDNDESDLDDHTESNTSVKNSAKVKQLGKSKEQDGKTVKPKITRRRVKSKQKTSDGEQMSKIESRRPIQIKEEPVSESEIDPSEEIIDGVKRELRPRKLNEGTIYFKPYDGSTSEESYFTDTSE